jgi:hypothetical protein
MSQFLAVAWVVHPDLIPNEVGCVVPEPQEPFVDRQPPLFLRASEIIHSKRDTLGFHALVKILEVHDFSPQAGSSDDGSSSESSGSSGGDGLPRPVGHSSLRPWPATPPPPGRPAGIGCVFPGMVGTSNGTCLSALHPVARCQKLQPVRRAGEDGPRSPHSLAVCHTAVPKGFCQRIV